MREGIPGHHEPPPYRNEYPPYRIEAPDRHTVHEPPPYRTRASAIQNEGFKTLVYV